MKDKKWFQILKKIVLFILPVVIKNQKGIKGTANEGKIDEIFKPLD